MNIPEEQLKSSSIGVRGQVRAEPRAAEKMQLNHRSFEDALQVVVSSRCLVPDDSASWWSKPENMVDQRTRNNGC